MSFKARDTKPAGNIDWEEVNKQVDAQLEEGLIVGVLSGLVDLGTQERESYEHQGQLVEPKPVDSVALFIDFPEIMIDWDACAKNRDSDDFVSIGTKPYRMLVNPAFKGDVRPIPFQKVPQRDADNKIIKGSEPTFQPTSPLVKLAKATRQKQILDTTHEDHTDIALMVGQPLLVNMEQKTSKGGFKFWNMASFSPPKDINLQGIDLDVVKPFTVTFTNFDLEDLKQVRFDVRKKMAAAINCDNGSAIYNALKESGVDMDSIRKSFDDEPAKKEPAKKAAADEPKAEPAPDLKESDVDFDDDIPF